MSQVPLNKSDGGSVSEAVLHKQTTPVYFDAGVNSLKNPKIQSTDSETESSSPTGKQQRLHCDREPLQGIINKKLIEMRKLRTRRQLEATPAPVIQKRANKKTPQRRRNRLTSTSSIEKDPGTYIRDRFLKRSHRSRKGPASNPATSGNISPKSLFIGHIPSVSGSLSVSNSGTQNNRSQDNSCIATKLAENSAAATPAVPLLNEISTTDETMSPTVRIRTDIFEDDINMEPSNTGDDFTPASHPGATPDVGTPAMGTNGTETTFRNGQITATDFQGGLVEVIDTAVQSMEENVRQLKNLSGMCAAAVLPEADMAKQVNGVLVQAKATTFKLYENLDAGETCLTARYHNLPFAQRVPLSQGKGCTMEKLTDYFEVLMEATLLTKGPHPSEKLKGVLTVLVNRILRIVGHYMCNNKDAIGSDQIFHDVTKMLLAREALVTRFTSVNISFHMLTFWQSIRANVAGGVAPYEQGAIMDHVTLGPPHFMERMKKLKKCYHKSYCQQREAVQMQVARNNVEHLQSAAEAVPMSGIQIRAMARWQVQEGLEQPQDTAVMQQPGPQIQRVQPIIRVQGQTQPNGGLQLQAVVRTPSSIPNLLQRRYSGVGAPQVQHIVFFPAKMLNRNGQQNCDNSQASPDLQGHQTVAGGGSDNAAPNDSTGNSGEGGSKP